MRAIITFPIMVYQKTMSFDHGPMKALYPYGFCRFYPSCSEYCRRSIMLHGVVHGSVKGVLRITRCNPWHEPGIDEP
ncbi:membrane protein insertion efficiency factor YidD [Patescibacteria group bacterium]|nr:membrane protein insertion efficiency factor YidD [Patescibacteria group bacterium]